MENTETKNMNYRSISVLETMIRATGLAAEAGFPSNARSAALVTQLNGVITAMQTHGTDQVSGQNTTESGVDLKKLTAANLRAKLREIAETAPGLDTTTYPATEAQFRMPRTRSYQVLLATARAVLEDVGPIKAGFVECGMPADFDEQLGEAIGAFATAVTKRDGGLSEQIGGTAGLNAQAREGVRILNQLGAVMKNLLRTNPAQLAAWEAASHIKRAPERSSSDDPGGTPPSAPPLPVTGGSVAALAANEATLPSTMEAIATTPPEAQV